MSASSEQRRGGRPGLWLWGRRLSQIAFLSFFLYLFLRYRYQDQDLLQGPLYFFFRLDPLLLLARTLPSWQWSSFFWPALVLVVLTVLLGRFFCGWICPLGTILDAVGAALHFGRRVEASRLSGRWRAVKYVVLVVLLTLALLGFDWIGIFDPLSLLFRSLALALYPALAYTGESFFDFAFSAAPEAWFDVLDSLYYFLKGPALPHGLLSYHLLLFTGGLFAAVLFLELAERRFWCKNLCPLGALLGVLAKWRLLKRLPVRICTDCGDCRSRCKMDSFAPEDGWQNVRECILCLSCQEACPEDRVRYRLAFSLPARQMPDIGRRRLVLGAIGAAIAVPFLKVDRPLKAQVIRPPGALPEAEFMDRCVRCGACMKVCVTNGLQPLLLERGLEGLWSPALVPRRGYCEFRCTLCGQACPTGAIQLLPLEDKQKTVIGEAFIDPCRCIPYALGKNCLVCEEHCPTAPKAIILRPQNKVDEQGNVQEVKLPVVREDRCIGCGICETKCPVQGSKAGIRVRPPAAGQSAI